MANISSSPNSLKETAVSFLQHATEGKIAEAYESFVSPQMQHHNLFTPSGAANLQKGMEENHTQFPHKIYEVKHALEDGNLVAVHGYLRLSENGPRLSTVHLFRFDDGKIAELWDVVQPIPEDLPNTAGAF